jgi:hypothetical protein
MLFFLKKPGSADADNWKHQFNRMMLFNAEFPRVLVGVRKHKELMMSNLDIIETKAFVPAKDFELSKRFYSDLGFNIRWSSDALACMECGDSVFLLQNFYEEQHAKNFMMHLWVKDADSWWDHISKSNLAAKYDIKLGKPEDRPWGMRDLTLIDPSGVLWRIGHDINAQ